MTDSDAEFSQLSNFDDDEEEKVQDIRQLDDQDEYSAAISPNSADVTQKVADHSRRLSEQVSAVKGLNNSKISDASAASSDDDVLTGRKKPKFGRLASSDNAFHKSRTKKTLTEKLEKDFGSVTIERVKFNW